MKIIKRLSLNSTLYQRQLMPKPHDSWLPKLLNYQSKEREMTVEEELVKNGYTTKPGITPLRFLSVCLVMCGTLFFHLYSMQIYKNELRARNKYRPLEKEHSSLLLKLRTYALVFGDHIEKNWFTFEVIGRNGTFICYSETKALFKNSEGIIRGEQYRNYMKKKDRKFDFMDIGVMEKFPFPGPKD